MFLSLCGIACRSRDSGALLSHEQSLGLNHILKIEALCFLLVMVVFPCSSYLSSSIGRREAHQARHNYHEAALDG